MIFGFGSQEQGRAYSLQAPISIALDSSEVKVLNVETEWNLKESRRAAEKIIESHVQQVCESSLAGLAHNPFWTSLYAFLLVGPYFSLFAWKTRPDAELLQSLPDLPKAPSRRTPSKLKEALIANRKEVVKQRVERFKNTPLPEVIYCNEPIFTLKSSKSLKWYDKATLSPKYLYALSLPASALSGSGGLVCQPSWFMVKHSSVVDNSRQAQLQKDKGLRLIRKGVIDRPIQNELSVIKLASNKPDPTLRGPKPPDSSDSQQSRFSETEPQIVDPDAGPHQMRTRASTRDNADDFDPNIMPVE